MDRADVLRIADRAECAARGWAAVLAVMACLSLPVLWVERLDDGARNDEYLSVWGAVPVLFGDDRDVGDGQGVALAGLAFLALGLGAASYVATSWLTSGVGYDGVSRIVRNGAAVLLVVGGLVLAVGANTSSPVGSGGDDPSTGLGLGAGLWAVFVLAFALTAPMLVKPRS